ncbi:hypothetical protein DL546_009904 [Coniochaeta pulveracea]|uniref:Uncharacterized protein n=1 Tax=Coniochaeta pulveracea TaxID=177199 RepID=A0A420YGK9_9PEZI|nr:hypothetical protein DL546_009904 [Coniochaeta pulveracea]
MEKFTHGMHHHVFVVFARERPVSADKNLPVSDLGHAIPLANDGGRTKCLPHGLACVHRRWHIALLDNGGMYMPISFARLLLALRRLLLHLDGLTLLVPPLTLVSCSSPSWRGSGSSRRASSHGRHFQSSLRGHAGLARRQRAVVTLASAILTQLGRPPCLVDGGLHIGALQALCVQLRIPIRAH